MNPGDVVLQDFLVEAKVTRSRQFTLKSETIDKIDQEGNMLNKDWALVIEMDGRSVAVVDFETFKELCSE